MWRGFETKALYDNHMKNQVKQEGVSQSKDLGAPNSQGVHQLPPCLQPESLRKDEQELNELEKLLNKKL